MSDFTIAITTIIITTYFLQTAFFSTLFHSVACNRDYYTIRHVIVLRNERCAHLVLQQFACGLRSLRRSLWQKLCDIHAATAKVKPKVHTTVQMISARLKAEYILVSKA